MPIVRTDEWLVKLHSRPLQLCERLTPYFEEATARDIYLHLIQHGMYQPSNDIANIVDQMKKKRMWKHITTIYEALKKQWNSPDVPIFLFPADPHNRKLAREFNSKGGLAYPDKLFLFLLPHHTEKEIKAVFTHEYNHVWRFAKHEKQSDDYTLLDAIILEGLAENAVREYVGDTYKANWTTYYSEQEIIQFWRRYLSPHQSIPVHHPLYNRLLYGLGFYPNMLGYAVGYSIVHHCLQKRGVRFSELMELSSERIVQLARLGE
ncbi:DUF2268 domain-containing protein [Anoxybacillus caldiproteolyticus]|nr:DUF2268 domain-containing protein [Anoxybacillus caldiproteolyticus]